MVKPSEINSRSGRFLQAAGGSVSCAIKFNCDSAAIKTNLAEMITRTRAARVPAVVRRIGGRGGLTRMRGLQGHPEKVFSVRKKLVLIPTKDPTKLLNPQVLLLIPREP